MNEDPFKKSKPAFTKEQIDEIETKKELEEEAGWLIRDMDPVDDNNIPHIPPGFISEAIADTDPQAQ